MNPAMLRTRIRPGCTVLIGLGLLFAFTAIYTAAYHDPRPHGVPVGIVGSEPPTALARLAAGGFALRRYASEPDARQALLHADVNGVLVTGGRADQVLVAGAYGRPATQLTAAALAGVAGHAHGAVAVRDIDPLPRHDSFGLASFFTVFGTVLPSLLFGALLAIFHRGQPGRVRRAILLAYSLLAGIVVAFAVQTVVGALSGHFWTIAGLASLLALAVASLSFGLERLLGPLGVAVAALIVMLLGQSSTGGAIGSAFQPGFYRAISELLPNGAALTVLHNAVYFRGAHVVFPLVVIVTWALAGMTTEFLADRRKANDGPTTAPR
jgi:hypothetical protein